MVAFCDEGSFLELRRVFGRSIITGFIRLEGRPLALIANDCQQLGGLLMLKIPAVPFWAHCVQQVFRLILIKSVIGYWWLMAAP
ncbi:MAG: carboxyl transferase domain-containing protein [Parahaliea sp.]